ncbi:MAG: hypothetical protein ACFCGT_11630 [Sandaracinaceae bacterium]
MNDDEARRSYGEMHLARLKVFLDVVYAGLFLLILRELPSAEDLSWADQPWGLLKPLLFDDPVLLLRMFIGLGIILIYWNLNNRFLAPLVRSDTWHATLSLVQMVFVALFMYFAIEDPALAGGPSSPALQCVSLVLAGTLGLGAWAYAERADLVRPELSRAQRRSIATGGLIEPLTALFNLPFAWVGPLVWTLGWVVIPLVLSRGLRWLRITAG